MRWASPRHRHEPVHAGSDSRLRGISRLAVLTYLAVLLVACW